MWHERFLRVIPSVVFLFCILSIFELFLIIEDMNKTEKLEVKIRSDLKMLEGMQLERFQDKKIRIK